MPSHRYLPTYLKFTLQAPHKIRQRFTSRRFNITSNVSKDPKLLHYLNLSSLDFQNHLKTQ